MKAKPKYIMLSENIKAMEKELSGMKDLLMDICPHPEVTRKDHYKDEFGSYTPDGVTYLKCEFCKVIASRTSVTHGLYDREVVFSGPYKKLEKAYDKQESKKQKHGKV